MKKANPIPSEIKEYLEYDSCSGVITWKVKRNRNEPGSLAGCTAPVGYIKIGFKQKEYYAHRIAWFLYYGEDPGENLIDHINRIKTDNRIVNLRLATKSQNAINQPAKGFSYYKHRKKWVAYITHRGVKHSLGYFDCPLIARLAYEDKKRELCGEFSPI